MVMHVGALRISRTSDASGKVRATSKVPAAPSYSPGFLPTIRMRTRGAKRLGSRRGELPPPRFGNRDLPAMGWHSWGCRPAAGTTRA